jgi:hypothetical protein
MVVTVVRTKNTVMQYHHRTVVVAMHHVDAMHHVVRAKTYRSRSDGIVNMVVGNIIVQLDLYHVLTVE